MLSSFFHVFGSKIKCCGIHFVSGHSRAPPARRQGATAAGDAVAAAMEEIPRGQTRSKMEVSHFRMGHIWVESHGWKTTDEACGCFQNAAIFGVGESVWSLGVL